MSKTVATSIYTLLILSMIVPAMKGESDESLAEVVVISTNTRAGFVNIGEILDSISYVDKTNAPDNIYHGAIDAFGKVFDFILNKGVVVTDKIEYYARNDPLWIDGNFQTAKPENEFLTWIEFQKETQFTTSSYDLVNNNCLTFVEKACQFLGIPEPRKLANLREFVIKHQESAKLVNAMLLASTPNGP